MPNDLLSVLIRNREKKLFEDQAQAVTATNDKGIFDILPRHANFISLIKNQIIVYTARGEKYTLPVKTGILRVQKNTVHIFLVSNVKYIPIQDRYRYNESGKL